MKFYVQIDDCIAAIAAEFSGIDHGHFGIWDLLRWTHRAVEREEARIEMAKAMRGL